MRELSLKTFRATKSERYSRQKYTFLTRNTSSQTNYLYKNGYFQHIHRATKLLGQEKRVYGESIMSRFLFLCVLGLARLQNRGSHFARDAKAILMTCKKSWTKNKFLNSFIFARVDTNKHTHALSFSFCLLAFFSSQTGF